MWEAGRPISIGMITIAALARKDVMLSRPGTMRYKRELGAREFSRTVEENGKATMVGRNTDAAGAGALDLLRKSVLTIPYH
jgi:hypothetical protein